MSSTKVTRRNALSVIAAAGVSLSIVGTGSASGEDLDERVKAARQLREVVSDYKNAEQKKRKKEIKKQAKSDFKPYLKLSPTKAYRKYIADSGFGVSHRSGSHQMNQDQGGDDGNIGTEEYTSSMFNWTLTLSYDCNDYSQTWADLYFYFDGLCDDYRAGEDPKDVVGLYFPSTDYSRIDGTEYSDDYCYVGGTDGDLDPNGIAWEYDDWAHLDSFDQNCPSPGQGVGMKLLQNSPDDPASSRLVAMDYEHTAGYCSISSVSVGTGGITVGYSCGSPTEWTITDDQGEDGVIGCQS